MKRAVTILLACVLSFSVSLSAVAAELETPEVSDDVNAYAYMSLEAADEITREQILAARSEIIMNTSWVDDSVNGWIRDESGAIVDTVPHFSDLFPADWEVPVLPSTPTIQIEPFSLEFGFNGNVWLSRPPQSGTPNPFYTLNTVGFPGTAYEYYVESISTVGYYGSGATYNIGYINNDTGRVVGNQKGLDNGKSFEISAPIDASVSVYASTEDSVGNWTMIVTYEKVNAY